MYNAHSQFFMFFMYSAKINYSLSLSLSLSLIYIYIYIYGFLAMFTLYFSRTHLVLIRAILTYPKFISEMIE